MAKCTCPEDLLDRGVCICGNASGAVFGARPVPARDKKKS